MYYYSSLILNRLHTLGNCSALTYANKPHLVLNLVLLKSSLSLNYRKFLVDYSNFNEKNFASFLVDFRWTDYKLVRCRLILLRIKKMKCQQKVQKFQFCILCLSISSCVMITSLIGYVITLNICRIDNKAFCYI